jgi:hypothetical protein
MEFNIQKIKVSMDYVSVSSGDRRRLHFDPKTIGDPYKYLGMRPTKDTSESNAYEIFHEYKHRTTNNKLHIFTQRPKSYYYPPNLKLWFFSSWDNNLTYKEVIEVMNIITDKYNPPFNLSGYHVAIDLFSDVDHNHIDDMVKWMKSGRHYDPEMDPKYPGTYWFHTETSKFGLCVYDKKQQLLSENKELSKKSIRELMNCNVTRIESRFFNAIEITTLPELAVHCFIDLIPTRVEFLMPDDTKLIKHGLKPHQYQNIGLKELKKKLKKKGVESNLFYYTKENIHLTNMVRKALEQYRWCASPNTYPTLQPKISIRPQCIKLIKH